MSKELWQQVKQALTEAASLDPDQRTPFLEELEKQSPELRSEVESLLASQQAAESDKFLDETIGFSSTNIFDPDSTSAYDPDSTRGPLPDSSGDDSAIDFGDDSGLVGRGYELIEEVGRGGMGVVYKAYHRGLRRTVAVKIILGSNLTAPQDIARFHVEAEAAARLDHPGIVPVYDVGEHCGNHYYAMAYVEGPALSKFVGRKKKRLTPRRSAEIMEEVSLAVQFAHDRAVIHRDLKPANIILEGGNHPRLADFGLAKVVREDEGLTMTGQVMGTPSYMAPEQAAGRQDRVSNRTDVYSLGATLYALLAGRPPFAADTLLETIRMVVHTEPAPIESGVPRDLQTICEKCLAKDPEDRYESAGDVADDLRRHLDGFPITARPAGPWTRAVRWCRRNPVVASLLGITLFALLTSTVISLSFGIEAGKQAEAARQALHEAELSAQQLREAIRESFVFASEDVLAREPGMQRAREVLLQAAQRYYAELVQVTPNDSKSLREAAEARFMLGKVQMALGKDREARTTLVAAQEVQNQLLTEYPNSAETLAALAKTHNELARLCETSWRSLTKLDTVSRLPHQQAAMARERLQAWQTHAAEAVRLRQQTAELNSEDVESQRLLASATMNLGIATAEQAIAGESEELHTRARELMLEAQQLRQDLLDEHPEERQTRRDLARGYINLANVEVRTSDQLRTTEAYQQRLQQAVEDVSAGITAYEQLLQDRGEAAFETQLELAKSFRLRADAQFKRLNQESAEKDYRRALKLAATLVMRNPNVYRYRIPLAETQYNLCNLLFFQKKPEQATRLLADCRATLLQAIRIDPDNDHAGNELVQFTSNAAEALSEMQDFPLALKLVNTAIGELDALRKESAEYTHLQDQIESLKKTAAGIRQQHQESEQPEDVV